MTREEKEKSTTNKPVKNKNKTNYIYEGRSEINASCFIMLAHDVRGEYC